MPPPITIPTALEVFGHGFAFQRSRTHPFLTERYGSVWVLRDGPRRSGNYRREEWLASGEPPAEVDALARAHTRGNYCICAIHPIGTPFEPLRDAYKALGYRLGGTEPLMVQELAELPDCLPPAPVAIARVTTVELAERLMRAAGRTQIAPQQLGDDCPQRQWVALDGEEPVGWVGSIQVSSGWTWCANMFVRPEHRRRGIARAMLSVMLADDHGRGSPGSVLLASHAGAKLYPVVGYRQIGTLLGFNPPRGG